MTLTLLQKKTAEAIVNIFETGSVQGDYANVTLLRGDSGGLTYGRSQTTRNSGNLYLLIRDYCNAPGAAYATALEPYQARLKARDASLDSSSALKQILQAAGSDPIMREVQDRFFDAVYWEPAARAAATAGIVTPLGVATVYDGIVHGSWARMAKRATAAAGTVAAAGEGAWVLAYLRARRAWLKGMPPPLPNTTYRQDAFLQLIGANNWNLDLPLTIRGLTISLETMGIAAEEAGAAPWQLLLNGKVLGPTWQNPEDEYRNYFPIRALLLRFFPEDQVSGNLFYNMATHHLSWMGKDLTDTVPSLMRGRDVWCQVRGMAGAMGLVIDRDETHKMLNLHR